jgi:hypothetical protein
MNEVTRSPMTVEEVRDLLIAENGNVSAVARALYRSRSVVKNWIDTKPELVATLMDMREEVVDQAERNIFAAVSLGDQGASKFVAMTLGKDRGWVPREEKTGKDGADLIPSTIVFAMYAEDEPEMEEVTEVVEALEFANDSE